MGNFNLLQNEWVLMENCPVVCTSTYVDDSTYFTVARLVNITNNINTNSRSRV